MRIKYAEFAVPLKFNARVITKQLDMTQRPHRAVAAELDVDLTTMVVKLVAGEGCDVKGTHYIQAIRVVEADAVVVKAK